MKEKIIYKLSSVYRDDFRITGYLFGDGEPSVCIVGAIRGNEIQQLFTCSQLVKRLKMLEENGDLTPGKSILVIPSVNPYSLNIRKRFWPTDNTDINRMFPGYHLGETTQRIAAGVFDVIKEYKLGIQFASFYMPGVFIPHVRMMDTGYQDTELAKKFGLPYVVIRTPQPYDTTTLNYNLQLWNSNAFSLYTHETDNIDKFSSKMAVDAVLRFLKHNKIIRYNGHEGYSSQVIMEKKLVPVKAHAAGIFDPIVYVEREVEKGDLLAQILNPYDSSVEDQIISPTNGTVFFMHNHPLTYNNTVVFKIMQTS